MNLFYFKKKNVIISSISIQFYKCVFYEYEKKQRLDRKDKEGEG